MNSWYPSNSNIHEDQRSSGYLIDIKNRKRFIILLQLKYRLFHEHFCSQHLFELIQYLISVNEPHGWISWTVMQQPKLVPWRSGTTCLKILPSSVSANWYTWISRYQHADILESFMIFDLYFFIYVYWQADTPKSTVVFNCLH